MVGSGSMSCSGMSSLDCNGWSLLHTLPDCKMDGKNEEIVENMLCRYIHDNDGGDGDNDDEGEDLFSYI